MASANVASFFENGKSLIYPGGNFASQIPLWMKFYCYEYNNLAFGRVAAQNAAAGGGAVAVESIPGFKSKEKAQIFLPAPVNFQTNTSHSYTAKDLYSTAFPEFVSRVLEGVPAAEGAQKVLDFFEKKILSGFEAGLGIVEGFQSALPGSGGILKDNAYSSEGPSRSYEIKFNLPCLTVDDSMKAAEIVSAFEALSLPTSRGLLSVTTSKVYHPPMWVFGIGPLTQRTYDTSWSGMPQLSLLRSVSHKKTALETNALAALGLGANLKPVCYSLSLSFVELEPAFRATRPGSSTSFNIINRSTVLTTTGSSGVAGSQVTAEGGI